MGFMPQSAPIQDAPTQRCSITLEHVELSGFHWEVVGEAILHPADLAELRRWLTEARERGDVADFTITVEPH